MPSQCCFTRDHGAQLDHVDDELEAVAEDEDADDDDQDGPHHQVALLTLAQAAQPLRPGPGNMEVLTNKTLQYPCCLCCSPVMCENFPIFLIVDWCKMDYQYQLLGYY